MTEPIEMYLERNAMRMEGRRKWQQGLLARLRSDTSPDSLSQKFKKLRVHVRNTHLFKHIATCLQTGEDIDYPVFDEVYPRRPRKKNNWDHVLKMEKDFENLKVGPIKYSDTESIYLTMDMGEPVLSTSDHFNAKREHFADTPVTGKIRQKLCELRAYECMSHLDSRLRGGCMYSICCKNCYNVFEVYLHGANPLVKILDNIWEELSSGFICLLCHDLVGLVPDLKKIVEKIKDLCGRDSQLYIDEMYHMVNCMSYPMLMCNTCGGIVYLIKPFPHRSDRLYRRYLRCGFRCSGCGGVEKSISTAYGVGYEFLRSHEHLPVQSVSQYEAYMRSDMYKKVCNLDIYDVGYQVFYCYLSFEVVGSRVYISLDGMELLVGDGEFRLIDGAGTIWFSNVAELLERISLRLPPFSVFRYFRKDTQLRL